MKCAEKCGIEENFMKETFLKGTHIYVWVDSKDVQYRIGDDGSVGTLFDEKSTYEWQKHENISKPKKKVCIDITTPEGHQLVLDHKGKRPVDLLTFLEENDYMIRNIYHTNGNNPVYFTANAILCNDCAHEGIAIISAILDEKCENCFYVAANQLEILKDNPFLCQNAYAIESEESKECNHSVECYDQF